MISFAFIITSVKFQLQLISAKIFTKQWGRINPTTQQLIDKTCTCRYSSTSATGWLFNVHEVRNKDYRIIIIIIIKKRLAMQGQRGRLTPYQSEYPNPILPTYRGKEEKWKIVETKKERATRPTKRHLICSWNPKVPYHRTRGQPDRSREKLRWGNKTPAVLRGSAAGRRISIPFFIYY